MLLRAYYTSGQVIAGVSNTAPNVKAFVGVGPGVSADELRLEWTIGNKINYAGPGKVKIKVSTKNGQIKGSAAIDGAKWKVEGVVFQKQDLAAGLLYIKGGRSRSLVIVPME